MKWEGCRIYEDTVRYLGYQRVNKHASVDDLVVLGNALDEAQVVKASSVQLAQIVDLINVEDAQFAYRGPFKKTFVEFDQEVFTELPDRGVVGFLTIEDEDELEIWPVFRTPELPGGLIYGWQFNRDLEGIPVGGRPLSIIDAIFEEEHESVKTQFDGLVKGAFVYASALFELLQSTNVALAAEPVSRQVRRKAKRENAAIPLVVTVTRSGSVSEARGGTVDYSHQWDVRGFFRYTTRGRKFDACPADKLVKRPSDGALAVKEWVNPHVKGPADKPYIPKVRDTRKLGVA